jgi:uncharacterized repeat protein (TIGR01451 family)
MKTITNIGIKNYLTFGCLFIAIFGFSQTVTSPQVLFSQRTAAATPSQTIYNIKGDFTLIGNTNLTLATYADGTDNQNQEMRFVDIDGDTNTLNSSKATLELSNSGENSATQNCSTVLFAGLYWTGKSDDANETFTANRRISSGQTALSSNYTLTVSRGGPSSSNYYPIYTFATITGTPHTYAFSFTNATSGSSIVTLSIDNGAASDVPVTYNSVGIATFTTPYTSNAAWGTQFTLTGLTRSTLTNLSLSNYQSSSSAGIVISPSKTFDKKSISFKGPGASGYTTINTSSTLRFPGASNSGIFVGYQEVTNYVKTHGPGAYTVADIALIEGNNGNQNYAQNPGYSGGWGLVVIYENPVMKSRAVTLFDGYAYVNGQLAGGGEYGNIDISGFTTVGSGQVNMKLGVMAAEGDRNLSGDYLAVQKLTADPTKAYNNTNYWAFNTAGLGNTTITQNFFNSLITGGNRTPNLVNNTGVDFSMFTIPNTGNLVIGNNQTSTTFRFGSTSDVFTIFGFAMSVDAYIPEPKGLSSVNSINGVSGLTVLNALPGQSISYTLSITNEGTEATNNTIITIPVPATAIFHTGTITSNLLNGATQVSAPIYNSGTNTITWNLGTLPITAGHPEYVYANLSFTLDVTTDCSVILNAGCSPEVSLENGTITGTGAISGSPFTKYFFQGYDETTCHLPISGSIIVAIDTASCLSAMAGPNQTASCGGESVTLAATEAIGLWTIVSGPAGGGEIFSNNTSPISTFYSPNIGAYTLRWTTSCATTDDVLITFELCNVINFDGTDDHINFKNEFNLNSGSFSIEAWIKSGAVNSNTQTIISKRFSTSSTDGYDLRLVNNSISFNWNNGNAITSTYPIDSNRWYHIAVTFSGSNYNLYVDGILVAGPISGANPTSNSVNFIVGAMDQNNITPFNYFNGWMDELRFWNTALTVDQIRQMMNQEIQDDGSGNIEGAIVPKNITGLTWSNLNGYYQMNGLTDVVSGYMVDKATTPINGKLKNIYTPQPETAPLPYTSRDNGAWETDASWTNYPVWDVPNSVGIDSSTKIDWNIVKTLHNISSTSNKTVLGLLVTVNTLSAVNDSKLEVSSYLKLDGKIDLVGKSQLLQTTNSDLDPTSSGSIERDQQGQVNKYNYNYWCSPVSPINTIANNTDYTVAAMLKDGTTSTPQNINWIAGYDGAATLPISIARYWLYTFDNYVNAYANWKKILETTPIRVGQGFTMKGSDNPPPSPSRIAQKTTNKVSLTETTQNYTFVGKPNNGLINSNTVLPEQLLLTGNPYPSALDAVAFINDNASSIDGTLYFWEHYTTNNSHVLREYQGGYASLNLIGGVPAGCIPNAVDVDFISGLGTPSKGAPNQYIPVGQGFFVTGNTGFGGTVILNNNQRAFYTEDQTGLSNIVFKTKSNNNTNTIANRSNNVPIAKDTLKRIRLGFNANNDYHRQLLLGFMNEKATSKMDYGYDSYILDDFPNDMYFLSGENQLVIQGEGFFDENGSYPIGVKTAVEGIISFTVDALENFNPEQPIFIYDNLTDTYHNIRSAKYEVNLPIGTNDTRFSLRFKDKTLKVDEHAISEAIQILYIQNGNLLEIKNKSIDLTVEKVTLYNILGQSISTWKIENQDQQNIIIPIKPVSSGIYIAKLKTFDGEISKKFIVFDD